MVNVKIKGKLFFFFSHVAVLFGATKLRLELFSFLKVFIILMILIKNILLSSTRKVHHWYETIFKKRKQNQNDSYEIISICFYYLAKSVAKSTYRDMLLVF